MVALVFSLIATIVLTALVPFYARRRPVGTPLTWGEAMVAAVYAFLLMFVIYGIVPHQWLTYAGNELGWRPDKIGIPAGPLGALLGDMDNTFFSEETNVFFPDGIPLANGYLTIHAQIIMDVIAALIYIVGLGVQIALWSMWQKRGKEKPKELPTSAYGRPLVKPGAGVGA